MRTSGPHAPSTSTLLTTRTYPPATGSTRWSKMTLPSGIGHSVTQRLPASTSVMVNEPPRLPRCLAQPRVPGSNGPSSCAISLLTSHSGQRATSVHAFQTASGSASNVASHSNKYIPVLAPGTWVASYPLGSARPDISSLCSSQRFDPEDQMTETVARPQLSDRYTATSGRVQLTGVQALARLPIDQHRRDLAAGRCVGTFISGYEGSPLAGYDQELGRLKQLLDANDVTFVPGLNEEAAATAVQGSQLACTLPGAARDGVIGIWYGKAPGLDRATDALRHGNLMGAHPKGGALVLVGDDPAAKSSTLPCASDSALADLNIPYLYPADSQDVLDLGRHAIELSRATGLWTGLKIVTAVADGSSTVDLAADLPAPRIPPGAGTHTPTARLLHPTLGELERDLVTNRLRLAREYARLNGLNRVVGRGPGDVLGVVAAGHTWLDVLAALRRLGIGDADLTAHPAPLLPGGMPLALQEGPRPHVAHGPA